MTYQPRQLLPPSPVKIFDVTRLAARLLEGKRPTGIDRVSLAYISHFRHGALALVRHGGRWLCIGEKLSQRVFAALLNEVASPAWTIRMAVIVSHARGPRVPSGALLFNTGHSGLDKPGYMAAIKRFGLKPIYFVHDLIPLSYPEFCREGESERHRKRLRTMLGTAGGLILNSQETAAELQAYAHAGGMELPPFVTVPIGTVSLPAPQPIPTLQRPYFVMLGTIEPRKNHLMILNLWRQMIEAGLPDIPELVIIGQRGWECEQVVDLLERSPALKTKVIERGDCADFELSFWLHHARALLFPSFAEGYGMPLAEALGHGVPVIASNLPVFHEIAGNIPDYLDPLDGTGWRKLLLEYTQPNSPARAAQLARLQGYEAPSWDWHFAVVASFVHTLEMRELI
jgi:glycosyltransferase involved in cell wall biosynthesis